jgi:hypothetical protein
MIIIVLLCVTGFVTVHNGMDTNKTYLLPLVFVFACRKNNTSSSTKPAAKIERGEAQSSSRTVRGTSDLRVTGVIQFIESARLPVLRPLLPPKNENCR